MSKTCLIFNVLSSQLYHSPTHMGLITIAIREQIRAHMHTRVPTHTRKEGKLVRGGKEKEEVKIKEGGAWVTRKG